jgi:uncharacterized protein GlcG (DUF336 family)
LLIAIAPAQLSHAQPTSPAQQPAADGPSLSLSLEAAQAMIADCATRDYKVAVTFLDSAGVTKLILVADGVGPRAVDSSANKARAALTLKMPTARAVEQMKTDAALAARISSDQTLFVHPGGVPLAAGGTIIGAVGVSGAPIGGKDDICLSAGLDRVKDGLK